jgi:hypothetical protein
MRKKGESKQMSGQKLRFRPDKHNDFTRWCRKSNRPLHRPCGYDLPDTQSEG